MIKITGSPRFRAIVLQRCDLNLNMRLTYRLLLEMFHTEHSEEYATVCSEMLMLLKSSYGIVSHVILHLPHKDTGFPLREAVVMEIVQTFPSHKITEKNSIRGKLKKNKLNIFDFSCCHQLIMFYFS